MQRDVRLGEPAGYVYPRLSAVDLGFVRIFGPGLGNLLFPWARATKMAHQLNLRRIFPTWPQLKWGPVFRRERDKRTYAGLFRPTERYVCGWKKAAALAWFSRIREHELPKNTDSTAWSRSYVVEFQGMDGGFAPILDCHELIRKELLDMTRVERRGGIDFDHGISVALHVRLGDFSEPRHGELEACAYNVRIPTEWYVAAVEEVRRELGENVVAFIISDGKDHELESLLKVPRTRRISFGSSIEDLLALSRANMLIASGSTFSKWASYLGRMPVLYYPGQLRQSLYIDQAGLEAEWRGTDRLPAAVVESVGKKFAKYSI